MARSEPTTYKKEGRLTLYLGSRLKEDVEDAARFADEPMGRFVRVAVKRRVDIERRKMKKEEEK